MKLKIRHGELVIKPAENVNMSEAKEVENYVAAHSETGHDHVLQGSAMILERPGRDPIIELKEDTPIVHKKSHDKHDTKIVKRGIYRLLFKKEHDPFTKTMRKVWD